MTAQPSLNLVASKWVHKVKYHLDGNVERYKACVVAQSFDQYAGIDYHETFSLVVKSTTVLLILSITVSMH